MYFFKKTFVKVGFYLRKQDFEKDYFLRKRQSFNAYRKGDQ